MLESRSVLRTGCTVCAKGSIVRDAVLEPGSVPSRDCKAFKYGAIAISCLVCFVVPE